MNTERLSSEVLSQRLDAQIRDIPDFPKPGILFKDITPWLQDPATLKMLSEQMSLLYKDQQIDYIAGIESRGFILGMPMAYLLNVGFIPIRKAGKLPAATYRVEYELEYGTDVLEVHQDAFGPGKRVLIVDDLLATGGTAAAAVSLIQQTGAELVGALFAIELSFLNGREKLGSCKTHSLIKY